jgi:hypothetical protein
LPLVFSLVLAWSSTAAAQGEAVVNVYAGAGPSLLLSDPGAGTLGGEVSFGFGVIPTWPDGRIFYAGVNGRLARFETDEGTLRRVDLLFGGPAVVRRGDFWPGGVFYLGLSSVNGPDSVTVYNERDDTYAEVEDFLQVALLGGPRVEWDPVGAVHLGATLEYRFTFPDVHTGERGMSAHALTFQLSVALSPPVECTLPPPETCR